MRAVSSSGELDSSTRQDGNDTSLLTTPSIVTSPNIVTLNGFRTGKPMWLDVDHISGKARILPEYMASVISNTHPKIIKETLELRSIKKDAVKNNIVEVLGRNFEVPDLFDNIPIPKNYKKMMIWPRKVKDSYLPKNVSDIYEAAYTLPADNNKLLYHGELKLPGTYGPHTVGWVLSCLLTTDYSIHIRPVNVLKMQRSWVFLNQYLKLFDPLEAKLRNFQTLFEQSVEWNPLKYKFSSLMNDNEKEGAYFAIETQRIINNYFITLFSREVIDKNKLPLDLIRHIFDYVMQPLPDYYADNQPNLLSDYQQIRELLMYHVIGKSCDLDIIPDVEVSDLLTASFNALLLGSILGIFPIAEGITQKYLGLYQNLPHMLPKNFTYLIDPLRSTSRLCDINEISLRIRSIKQKAITLNTPNLEEMRLGARQLLSDFILIVLDSNLESQKNQVKGVPLLALAKYLNSESSAAHELFAFCNSKQPNVWTYENVERISKISLDSTAQKQLKFYNIPKYFPVGDNKNYNPKDKDPFEEEQRQKVKTFFENHIKLSTKNDLPFSGAMPKGFIPGFPTEMRSEEHTSELSHSGESRMPSSA